MTAESAPILFHAAVTPDPQARLVLEGFSRRTTAAEPRLSELVAQYREIGWEVEVVPHRLEPGACTVCFEPAGAGEPLQPHFDIYVRRR